MQDRTLNDVLRRLARDTPERIAFRTPQRNWTFADMDRETNRVAQGLLSLGVKAGDRVAALTRHTAECLVLALGATKLGAVCMPVNWRLAGPEVDFIVGNGEARLMMTDALFAPLAKAAPNAARLPTVITDGDGDDSFAAWCARFPATDPLVPIDSQQTALQLYSSGTTGLPKGVELTHANLLATFEYDLVETFHYRGADSVLFNPLPTFHIAGIGLGLMTLLHGGESVLYPEFDPPRILAGIAEHRITHMFMVPAMIHALLLTPGVAQADLSSLQMIAYGASPISDKVLVDAIERFRCGFLQVYGLTETCGAVTYLLDEDHDPGGPRAGLLRAAGKPGSSVGLRIVDAGSGKDLAEGEVGEVWIRTRQNMAGYWRNPEATRAVFPEGRDSEGGWFRTGDAGYVRDGYLFIHDRIKDMIISGGENIYPAEVENVLMQHPSVADGAIIGVPDEKWGEGVKACVVVKPGVTPDERDIIAFMRERLAHFKCPKSVDFMTALPRNPSGKLLKFQLRKPYWEGRDRQVS